MAAFERQSGLASDNDRTDRRSYPILDPYHISQSSGIYRKAHVDTYNESARSEMPVIAEGIPLDPLVQTSSRTSVAYTASTWGSSSPERHGHVRSLPVWIDSFEVTNRSGVNSQGSEQPLSSPTRVYSAQHHHSISNTSRHERRISHDGYVSEDDTIVTHAPERGIFGGNREPVRGRKWDHARVTDPVIMSKTTQSQAPWITTLMKSSMYGPGPNEETQKVDNDYLRDQTPGYAKPWRGDIDDEEKSVGLFHSKKERRKWYKRMQHTLLMHPLVPLAFRVTVLTTSTIALALAASVYHIVNDTVVQSQSPSTIMAIVVDTIAIPYIGYITWDEYTGKPLGLRSPKAKMRLVLLDLWFIIFESANLAIAFSALTDDTGACRIDDGGVNVGLCNRSKALASFLLIALVAWALTFSVSIFRLVERVGGREEGD